MHIEICTYHENNTWSKSGAWMVDVGYQETWLALLHGMKDGMGDDAMVGG